VDFSGGHYGLWRVPKTSSVCLDRAIHGTDQHGRHRVDLHPQLH
jgi:hypothetical protein